MDHPKELEFLKNFKPSINDLIMKNPFIKFDVEDGDTGNCPLPNKSTKFLSIEVEVITPLGWGTGVYNYMDNDWLVELYGDVSDELQAYKDVTHWRYITYKTEEAKTDYRLTRNE